MTACIEIFSRLWDRLENLGAQDTEACLQIIRLELVLLIGKCDSPRWELLLDCAQRKTLRATLDDVLEALKNASASFHTFAIEMAQNRLLDAIRTQFLVPERALLEGPRGPGRFNHAISRNHFAASVRNMVQAAAENTSTFATMTGDALISTP